MSATKRDLTKIMRVPLTMEILRNVFLQGMKLRAEVVSGLPADGVILRHYFDQATGFYWLTVQSETFEQIKTGGGIPALPIVCKSLAPELPLDDLTQMAYRAYGESTGNKNFRGEEMPAYHELPERIRAAWRAAVMAVAPDRIKSELPSAADLDATAEEAAIREATEEEAA
jgi:hypothetical protein